MSRFCLPRDIYHGKGSLEELKNLKGEKAILVVGGGSMKRQGFLDNPPFVAALIIPTVLEPDGFSQNTIQNVTICIAT